MARAYKKTYLKDAMRNLAVMFDCGVSKYGYSLDVFYELFLTSDVSRQFAHGNPRYLAGLSGAELADLVVQSSGEPISEKNDGSFSVGPEYWAGWALAFYQWRSDRSFSYMRSNGLGITEIVSMYQPMHEADLMKFVEVADGIINRNRNR